MNTNLFEKTLATKNLYKGRVIDLNIEEVQLPNGKHSTRELIKHPGAVAIIALTPDNKVVLVRQFRKALNKTIVEIPAGKIETGEQPLLTAKRELEEETGYQSDSLRYITSFYTSPGFADELIYLYFTDHLSEGTANMDEDEFVDLLVVSLDEAEEMMKTQEIHDAKTVFAIQYLKLKQLEG